jgi:hypothetical protein
MSDRGAHIEVARGGKAKLEESKVKEGHIGRVGRQGAVVL